MSAPPKTAARPGNWVLKPDKVDQPSAGGLLGFGQRELDGAMASAAAAALVEQDDAETGRGEVAPRRDARAPPGPPCR
jgi:hypothetical protein